MRTTVIRTTVFARDGNRSENPETGPHKYTVQLMGINLLKHSLSKNK